LCHQGHGLCSGSTCVVMCQETRSISCTRVWVRRLQILHICGVRVGPCRPTRPARRTGTDCFQMHRGQHGVLGVSLELQAWQQAMRVAVPTSVGLHNGSPPVACLAVVPPTVGDRWRVCQHVLPCGVCSCALGVGGGGHTAVVVGVSSSFY
jgi:hypothetical protein